MASPEPSSSFCASEGSVSGDSLGGGEVGTFLGGSGGSVPVVKVVDREESRCFPVRGAPQTSGSSSLVFGSSKAVSSGGPNKAVASSGTGDFLLLAGSGAGAEAGARVREGAGAGTGKTRLGRAISSLCAFLFARLGLRLRGEGDRAMLPTEAFNSSTDGAAMLASAGRGLILILNFLRWSSSSSDSLDEKK